MPIDDLVNTPSPSDQRRSNLVDNLNTDAKYEWATGNPLAVLPYLTGGLLKKKPKDPNDVSKGKLKKYTRRGEFQALQDARNIADREYTPYEGDRIAGMSENEQLGYNLARDAATNGTTKRLASKAEGSIDQANQDFNSQNLSQYENPYKEQVTDIALRKANEDFESQRSDLRGNLAASDAFGSDRGALLESQLNKDHETNVGDITVKGMSDAFDKATGLFMQDSQRRLGAAQAYQSLGNDVTRMNAQQVSDLVATGGLDRLLRQAQLDTDYDAFIEERDWDVNNLQPLLQTLSVLNKSPNAQPGGEKEKKNTWSTILGVVGTAVGTYYGSPQAGGAIGSGIGGAIDG